MPCVIDTHAMLGHAGSTTSRIANVARRVPEAKPVLGHAGPADDTAAAAGLIRDIPNS